MTVRDTTGPSGSGSQRRATSSIEALPQMPHDAVATKWRSATFESSNGCDSRTTMVSSGWLSDAGSPPAVEITSGPSIRPSVRRNPTASSASWPGVRIVTATATGVLLRAGRADLQRRLADDPVVADLQRLAPDRDDPTAGHVADRQQRFLGHGHLVTSSVRPNAVSASPAVLAASAARASAASESSPGAALVQAMNRSAAVPYAASIDPAA